MPDPSISPSPIAVATPCYNEAAALGAVIDEWRATLPVAEIVVLDNNSTDGSPQIASAHAATLIHVAQQGKGHVVRTLFESLRHRPAVIMIDGDGTYPADAVGPLLAAVLEGRADMAVGVRQPVPGAGAMSLVRRLGNLLIRAAFTTLIVRGHPDLLSGYRVFSSAFLNSFTPRSAGFEIETELACEAVARRLSVVAVDVPYRPRIAGTQSKLRAFSDGSRILRTILAESLRLKPWRLAYLLTVALVLACLVATALTSSRFAYLPMFLIPLLWIPAITWRPRHSRPS